MRKVRETITRLAAGETPGALRIHRREHEPMSDERLGMVLGFTTKIAAIVAGTVFALGAPMPKVVAVLIAAFLFTMVHEEKH